MNLEYVPLKSTGSYDENPDQTVMVRDEEMALMIANCHKPVVNGVLQVG